MSEDEERQVGGPWVSNVCARCALVGEGSAAGDCHIAVNMFSRPHRSWRSFHRSPGTAHARAHARHLLAVANCAPALRRTRSPLPSPHDVLYAAGAFSGARCGTDPAQAPHDVALRAPSRAGAAHEGRPAPGRQPGAHARQAGARAPCPSPARAAAAVGSAHPLATARGEPLPAAARRGARRASAQGRGAEVHAARRC